MKRSEAALEFSFRDLLALNEVFLIRNTLHNIDQSRIHLVLKLYIEYLFEMTSQLCERQLPKLNHNRFLERKLHFQLFNSLLKI